MKAIQALLAIFLLVGTLALNVGSVQAEQAIYEDGKPVGFNPADDL